MTNHFMILKVYLLVHGIIFLPLQQLASFLNVHFIEEQPAYIQMQLNSNLKRHYAILPRRMVWRRCLSVLSRDKKMFARRDSMCRTSRLRQGREFRPSEIR